MKSEKMRVPGNTLTEHLLTYGTGWPAEGHDNNFMHTLGVCPCEKSLALKRFDYVRLITDTQSSYQPSKD